MTANPLSGWFQVTWTDVTFSASTETSSGAWKAMNMYVYRDHFYSHR